MSRVDLDKNRASLVQAFQEVSNPKNDTNWILFGYEGQTTALKLVSKGEDGIEELIDDLSGGKIMYAYCRVKDPNTGLSKFVLINWQGEGVPEIKKGSCANHITDVSKLLKGAHITINARCDEDVDEDDIMKKVAKSSGANYSFHKEKARPGANEPAGPVGSVYQKTKPHVELKPDIRDKFWEKQRDEEKNRQAELQRKAAQEKDKADKERREREAQEAKNRDSLENERMKKIMEMKQAEKRANAADTEAEKEKWEKTQLEGIQDEDARRKRADQLRKERQNEAQSLVQGRQQNPRTAFEERPASQFDAPAKAPPPSRKLKHDFGASEEPQPPVGRKQPIQLPKGQEESRPAVSPPISPAAPSPPRAAPAPAPPSGVPQTRNLMTEGLPKRQDSDDDAEDQDWDEKKSPTNEPSTEDFSLPKSTEAQPPEDFYDDVQHAAPQQPEPEPQDLYDDVQHAAPQQSEPEPQDLYDDVTAPPASNPPEDLYDDVQQPMNGVGAGDTTYAPELGIVARALYDYQATEENEVTFDPDDLITNIDQIDPGWWVGVAPDGSQGMFPSNYVQILNG